MNNILSLLKDLKIAKIDNFVRTTAKYGRHQMLIHEINATPGQTTLVLSIDEGRYYSNITYETSTQNPLTSENINTLFATMKALYPHQEVPRDLKRLQKQAEQMIKQSDRTDQTPSGVINSRDSVAR